VLTKLAEKMFLQVNTIVRLAKNGKQVLAYFYELKIRG
jgi:hypothetical protein